MKRKVKQIEKKRKKEEKRQKTDDILVRSPCKHSRAVSFDEDTTIDNQ